MACRFPQAPSVSEFWELILAGRDGVTEVPRDRFDVDAIYDPEPATPGRVYQRRGGFLDGVDRFDAGFFGISPREAANADPQQRLLLEVAWDAIQDAGWVPEQQDGAQSGVFVGSLTTSYWDLLRDAGVLDIYSNVGTARS